MLITRIKTGLVVVGGILIAGCLASSQPELIKRDKPTLKRIVVLPVANQTNDIGAPVLIRYFCEKEVKSFGYKLAIDPKAVGMTLRQMGINDPSQINDSNVRSVGQLFKADVMLYGTLYQFSQVPGRENIVIEGRFQLLEIKTGRVLWERHLLLRKENMAKIPLPARLDYDWDESAIRSLSRSKAARPEKALVQEALSTLPSPRQLLHTFYRQNED